MAFAAFSSILIGAVTNAFNDWHTMRVKHTLHQNLTDQQRLERLAQLCEELEAAVDQAGDHRRLLEQLKETAQDLLTDEESRPQPKRSRRKTAPE